MGLVMLSDLSFLVSVAQLFLSVSVSLYKCLTTCFICTRLLAATNEDSFSLIFRFFTDLVFMINAILSLPINYNGLLLAEHWLSQPSVSPAALFV